MINYSHCNKFNSQTTLNLNYLQTHHYQSKSHTNKHSPTLNTLIKSNIPMSPISNKEEDQFTLPSQLYKSKPFIKEQKAIRKQNLRSKVTVSYNEVNIPKMIIDSQNQDIEEKDELIAKNKAKKWWRSFNKKYFPVIDSLQDAQTTINKVQKLPINSQKLCSFFETEFSYENDINYRFLHKNNSIRVLFRRQVALDEKQDHSLLFFELKDHNETISMIDEETENSIININGEQVELSAKSEDKLPSNLNIWTFRNPSKDIQSINKVSNSLAKYYPEPCNLVLVSMLDDISEIQNLLKQEKQLQAQQFNNSIDRQIKQWTKKYHQVFQNNQNYLQNLAAKIQENIDKRKLQEELKQRQEQIVYLTQKQLLWSQILLLFKKGHSDKTQQLLNDAQEIKTIKEMTMNEPIKKKKSTSLEKLKSLFQTDCKICFSTENDQKINKVFYCDGCNTSFHQICYGISKQEADEIIKLDKFYCDVCNYAIANKSANSNKKVGNRIGFQNQGKSTQKPETKQKKSTCQICCKPNFPMKLIDNHFYHVTCLFMFNMAAVKDSKITIKEDCTFQSILQQVLENEAESNFCEFCLGYPGMKIKCQQSYCPKWYHPICAYLNGIYFDLKRSFRKLDVRLYCFDHQPLRQRNIINQTYIRRFFCDYKKASNLTEDDFEEQYAKQIKQLAKDKAKQLASRQNLLLKKGKMSKPQLPLSLPSLTTGLSQRNQSQNQNYESCQNIKLNQSVAESSQQNQLEIQRNQLFQKIDHARFIDQDLDFN